LLTASGAAQAQAQAQAPTQSQTPQRTTATYDDWVVRCEIHGAAKACEMAQAMQIQGQSQPVTPIAIGQQGCRGEFARRATEDRTGVSDHASLFPAIAVTLSSLRPTGLRPFSTRKISAVIFNWPRDT
jgi:hypothetical protein